MKRKFFAAFLSLCMVLSLIPMTALAVEGDTVDVTLEDTLLSSIETAENGTTIRLTESFSVSQQITIPEGKVLTLDLNGQTLTTSDTILVNGNLTVMDATATVPPSISDDYETVTYNAGKIYNNANTRDSKAVVITVRNGGQLTHNSGTLESFKNYTVAVYGETRTANWDTPIDSTAVINGGYHVGQEGGPAVFGNGAILDISGGVIVGKDNSAVAGNGTLSNTENYGGTTINITGGTLIGHITSQGYIACGIYHPQEGALNISDGTIYADGGVGILMRAGNANITGGTIISTGTTTGKVGDNNATVSCNGVVYDESANYPGASESDKVSISGNTNITSENEVPAVTVMNNSGSNIKYMEIVGGSFSSDVQEYFPDGAILTQGEDGKVIPDTSLEESAVAKVNEVPYKTLESAIAAAKEGNTVQVVKDTALSTFIDVSTSITIDLNGCTVTGLNNAYSLRILGAGVEVTIDDNSSTGTGKITSGRNDSGGIVQVADAAKLTLESGTIEATGPNGGSPVLVIGSGGKIGADRSGATFNMTGGTLHANGYYALAGNGTWDGTNITISGGNIISDQCAAIYHPQEGRLTLTGGTISGTTAVQVCGGTLNIPENSTVVVTATGEDNRADKRATV